MNRRGFVRGASAAAAAAAFGIPAGGCLGFHYVTATRTGQRLIISRAEFGDRGFVLVDVPGFGLPLYVHREQDETYTAVSTRCMHQGCQVEPAGGRLVCPCHGSTYTASGDIVRGPTALPLRRYPASRQADQVVVDLSAGEPG